MLVIIAVGAWYVFGSGLHDNSGRADQIRNDIQSVGTEQQRAATEVTESKRIVDEVRTTNIIIKREIDDSRAINQSSSDLIREGKSIVQSVQQREAKGNK